MRLFADWYRADRATEMAAAALMRGGVKGASALMITGMPGVGKTSFAEALAEGQGVPFLYHQFHDWSDADELFVGVDVRAAVAGEADQVRQPGILAVAAEHSQIGVVVLCLDELDKAPLSVEALLLDFLQNGRVPVRPGIHLQANLDNLKVVITSNGQRPHSDALLRRTRRLNMLPLPFEFRVDVATRLSGAPVGVVKLITRMADSMEKAHISVQEVANAARECWEMAEALEDVRYIMAAWLARDADQAVQIETAPIKGKAGRFINAIWGEIKASRYRNQQGAA